MDELGGFDFSWISLKTSRNPGVLKPRLEYGVLEAEWGSSLSILGCGWALGINPSFGTRRVREKNSASAPGKTGPGVSLAGVLSKIRNAAMVRGMGSNAGKVAKPGQGGREELSHQQAED